MSVGWRIGLYSLLFVLLLIVLDPRTEAAREGGRFADGDPASGLQFVAGATLAVVVTSVTVLGVEVWVRHRRRERK